MIKYKIVLTFIAAAICLSLNAQTYSPVKWDYSIKKLHKTEAMVYIHARIDLGWHIYSQHIADGGPVKTHIQFNPTKDYQLSGETIESKSITRYYDIFNMNVSYFENEVTFMQKIKIKTRGGKVTGYIEYMADNDYMSIPPDDTRFNIAL